MSRVDEVPLYTNQSAAIACSIFAWGDREDVFKKFMTQWRNTSKGDWEFDYNAVYLGASGAYLPPLTEVDFQEYGLGFDEWRWYTYEKGKNSRRNIAKPIVFAEGSMPFWVKLLNSANGVYTDSEARYRILYKMIIDPGCATSPYRDVNSAAMMACKELMVTQIPYTKLTYDETINRYNDLDFGCGRTSIVSRYLAVAEAAEALLLNTYDHQNRAAHKAAAAGQTAWAAGMAETRKENWFSLGLSKAAKMLPGFHLHKVLAVWILVDKKTKETYIVDRASIDQIRLRAWSLYAGAVYAYNYRIELDKSFKGTIKEYPNAYDLAVQWLANTMKFCFNHGINPELIPRHMKICQTALISEHSSNRDYIDYGVKSHISVLLTDAKEALDAPVSWYEFIKKTRLSDIQRLDLSYLHHLCPGPDYHPGVLFGETIKRLNNEHPQKHSTVDDFFRYVDAVVLMEAVYTARKDPKINTMNDVGYDFRSHDWYARCLEGKREMPPPCDWGKARVFRHYPYKKKMEYWDLEAGDVTHVNAKLSEYMDPHRHGNIIESNEILYSHVYGNLLSRQYHPTKVREAFQNGKPIGDPVAIIAAKEETTKPGAKVRETYSACDIWREMISEIDHNIQSVNNTLKGPMLRESAINQTKMMRHLASKAHGARDGNLIHVFVSLDVTKWSPAMNRQFAMRFYQRMLETTEFPPGLDAHIIWKKIIVAMDKRGFKASSNTTKGNFQGWSGTADTAMHSLIAQYCINRAKREGIMHANDTAHVLITIDDGVIHLALQGKPMNPNDQKRAMRVLDFIKMVYLELGFVIDIIKTDISSVKFVFLNRIFALGSEVLMPMKIFMKINRELMLRFTSVFTQMQTAFNSAYGASSKGAGPLLSYAFASYLAFRWAFMSSPTLLRRVKSSFVIPIVALCPRSLGGWNVPSFMSWSTKEGTDTMSEFWAIMGELARGLHKAHKQNGLALNVLDNLTKIGDVIRSLPMRIVRPYMLAQMPRAVKIVGVIDPDNIPRAALRAGMLKITQDRQKLQLLRSSQDEHVMDAFDCLLKVSTSDAAILERIWETMPAAVYQAILDRCNKSEVIVTLMSEKQRTSVGMKVREADKQQLNILINYVFKGAYHHKWDFWALGATVAGEMRDEYHKLCGVDIVNHTSPACLDTLVHTNPQYYSTELSLCTVEFKPVLPPYQCKKTFATYFDGRADHCRSADIVTKGAVPLNAPGIRVMDPATKCLVKAAVFMQYLEEQGVDSSPLWDILERLWLGDEHFNWREIPICGDFKASSKRIATATSNTDHPIGFFPNAMACIDVDLTPLYKILSAAHTSHDYVQSIIALKTVCGLDKCMRLDSTTFRCYGVRADSVVYHDVSNQNYIATEEFKEHVAQITPVMVDTVNLQANVQCAIERIREAMANMQATEEIQTDPLEEGIMLTEVEAKKQAEYLRVLVENRSHHDIRNYRIGVFNAVTSEVNDLSYESPASHVTFKRPSPDNADASDALPGRIVRKHSPKSNEEVVMDVLRRMIRCVTTDFPIRDLTCSQIEYRNASEEDIQKALEKADGAHITPGDVDKVVDKTRTVYRGLPKLKGDIRTMIAKDFGKRVAKCICDEDDGHKWKTVLMLMMASQGKVGFPSQYMMASRTARMAEAWSTLSKQLKSELHRYTDDHFKYGLKNTKAIIYGTVAKRSPDTASVIDLSAAFTSAVLEGWNAWRKMTNKPATIARSASWANVPSAAIVQQWILNVTDETKGKFRDAFVDLCMRQWGFIIDHIQARARIRKVTDPGDDESDNEPTTSTHHDGPRVASPSRVVAIDFDAFNVVIEDVNAGIGHIDNERAAIAAVSTVTEIVDAEGEMLDTMDIMSGEIPVDELKDLNPSWSDYWDDPNVQATYEMILHDIESQRRANRPDAS